MPYYNGGYSPPRGGRNSYHLNPDPYYYRRRSSSRGREGAPEIHIHNDLYNEGGYNDARDAPMPSPPMGYPRGRSPYRGYPDPAAYGYAYPPPGAIPYPPGAYPPPRSRSRSDSNVDEETRRKRIIDDYRREEKEREEEMEKAIEDRERELSKERKKEKEAQDEAVRKHEQAQKEKEKKEKEAWEAYEAKRKEKERKEKEDKEKADEEYRERLKKHLATVGYTQQQIDIIVYNETKKPGSSDALVRTPSAQQQLAVAQRSLVYPKIRREHIAVETLKFYDLKWKYDETDSDFIVILQEMSDRQTDVLFAHTAQLREKGKATILQIEDGGKGKKPQYMMVRRRSKSREKSRGKSPSGAQRLAEAVLRGGP